MKIEKVNGIIVQLEEIADKYNKLEARVKNGTISLEIRRLTSEYMPVLKDLKQEKEKELFLAEEKVEKARLQLIELSKERKTLDKLREKDLHEYMQQIIREEQKLIDEIAVNSHYRKSH